MVREKGRLVAAEPTKPASTPGPKSKRVLVLALIAILIVAGLGVAAFALLSTPPPAPSATALRVSASDEKPFTGAAFTLTVTALRADDAVATNYAGEVTFESTDPLADLPQPTRYTAQDNGARTFPNVRVRTAGSVTVTARDNDANIQGSVTVTAERPPGAPTAQFTVDRSLMRVLVDASASSDPQNDIVSYEWDFQNDNTFETTDVTAAFEYTTPNRYTIRLRVTDSNGDADNATARVSVGQSTIDYTYWDFFNVPYTTIWELRSTLYWELPVNAECFSQAGIDEGLCLPDDPLVPDVVTYPYSHWYSALAPTLPSYEPAIYAPFRFRAIGENVQGYNTSEPVFLPVFNYSAAPGTQVTFDWYMNYMNNSRGTVVGTACGTNFVFGNDGYILESNIALTMDLQSSRRVFGVEAEDAAEATTWWATNTNPSCITATAWERSLDEWFVQMGGAETAAGKYDIMNGYEWYYQTFATNVTATVDPGTGQTTVRIDHVAYGTEVLLGRWFYWGNVSYFQAHLDSTRRAGWWGMENAWFEDFSFRGDLRPSALEFDLETVLQYTLWHICSPGPNGQFDRTDDVPIWSWGPFLVDYVNDFGIAHPVSELDRYPTATYIACTPGGPASAYGTTIGFDYTPVAWDVPAGETWHFQFPTGNVVFYDPNLTPARAFPASGEFEEVSAPMELATLNPSTFGAWDPATMTFAVLGPAPTGGPPGDPGPDGTPGTADDRYALEPLPRLRFVPGTSVPAPTREPAGDFLHSFEFVARDVTARRKLLREAT